MSKALALTAALTLVACSSAAQQNPSGSEVAARVGDRNITLDEIEKRWQTDDPAEHAEIVQKMYEGRRNAIDAIVAEMLFAEAAKGKGLSPAAYEEAEVSRRAKPVTDADVAAFYKTNLNEMKGQPFETMAPLITRYLQEQARVKARGELVAELKKSGPGVRLLLEPPRREVAVESSDPARGSASAAVTIIEFSDFQCPYCLRASPALKQLLDNYKGRVRLVWKDFPLTQIHPQAFKAAEAAHCAGDQGKFWEYHDVLFANQAALLVDDLKKYAKGASLDTARFAACLDTSKYAERVRDGVAMGNRLGVNSTPTMYINGRVVSGAYPYDDLAAIVDEELERVRK